MKLFFLIGQFAKGFNITVAGIVTGIFSIYQESENQPVKKAAWNLFFKNKQYAMSKKKEPLIKPDEETKNTTDPQEKMKGPVSSIMQNIKEEAEEDDKETKEEADKKKDKNT